jgi:Holliday junction resolvasome RuvABC DNA-binding subunit
MIRNENDFRIEAKRLRELEERIAERRQNLKTLGYTPEQIERAMQAELSLQASITEDLLEFERCKYSPEFPELINFEGIGYLLTKFRIAAGLTQRQLASLIGKHESQVSRDELNNYHGISTARIKRILNALKVKLKTTVVSINGKPVQPIKEQSTHE